MHVHGARLHQSQCLETVASETYWVVHVCVKQRGLDCCDVSLLAERENPIKKREKRKQFGKMEKWRKWENENTNEQTRPWRGIL